MRARPSSRHALIFGALWIASTAPAQEVPESAKQAAKVPTAPPQAVDKPDAGVPPKLPSIPPATQADVARERLAIGARLTELATPESKEKPTTKPMVELLEERKRLLGEWEKASQARAKAEKPEVSPEDEAAGQKAERDKTNALLEQFAKSPDVLLPEVFRVTTQAAAKGGDSDPRLDEMKEAIEAARNDLKAQNAELETLRSEGTRKLTAQVASDRSERDKVHQQFVALAATRAEREAAIKGANSAEARELAQERLANFEWEARTAFEQLATMEARIALSTKRLELGASSIQARSAKAQLAKKLLDRMESRYSALAERQQSDLKQAVAQEETRAALSADPLVRRKAKRTSALLELESQVVSYEKTYATGGEVSLQEQAALADTAVSAYAKLREMLDDDEISPLDALRLKNEFRRIGPERAQIVRTDLAAAMAEEVAYENALTDAEIDLVNDARDDRYDRETLLEQLPESRRAEASAMLEVLETRHRTLLNRKRDVLQMLARRAEETHKQVSRRIDTLDQEYAFIRTHIFWIRDAEPLGVAIVAHARDEAIRTARSMVRLGLESVDGSLWGPVSVEFSLAVLGMVALPWPLRLGQKMLDRHRLGGGA
ncbi:hypothetical protein P12x_003210 [Tundrisphaera lichenicola]|uniref:hypothetical protein n=1 Tax=Tundrisphaera lichenicola TaxID=2029860 RepID=UPI003EBB5B71